MRKSCLGGSVQAGAGQQCPSRRHRQLLPTSVGHRDSAPPWLELWGYPVTPNGQALTCWRPLALGLSTFHGHLTPEFLVQGPGVGPELS